MPHFQENEGWGHWTAPPPTPLSSIKVGFFKTMSLKKYFKTLLWHFLYMFLFRNPQAPFRQLGPSFLA